jgi:hypothetical protein
MAQGAPAMRRHQLMSPSRLRRTTRRGASRRQRFVLAVVVLVISPASQTAVTHAQPAEVLSRPAVVRGNHWFLRNTLSSGVSDSSFIYGLTGDVPLMGDWDGDGTETPGVVRGNTWYLRNSNSTGFADIVFHYGSVGDRPVVGDWDGNGTQTPGVVRGGGECGPFDCVLKQPHWYLRNSNSTGYSDLDFGEGLGPPLPISGHWDADDDEEIGWRRFPHSNSWFLDSDIDGDPDIQFEYGVQQDVPLAGDWDSDGIDSPGVVRGNIWYLRNSLTSGVADASFAFGRAGDTFLVWQAP